MCNEIILFITCLIKRLNNRSKNNYNNGNTKVLNPWIGLIAND